MKTKFLEFNGVELPHPEKYDVKLKSVEAATSGQTEAGTQQRDIIRSGVVNIAVSFSVSSAWLHKMSGYAKLDKIGVRYFDTDTLTLKSAEMYIDGYQASLVMDTAKKGFWSVSFTLIEM